MPKGEPSSPGQIQSAGLENLMRERESLQVQSLSEVLEKKMLWVGKPENVAPVFLCEVLSAN